MEVRMKRWMTALLTGLVIASGAAGAADDPAALEKRLEDAQRRLEDAAREVAELSGQVAGPAARRGFEGMRRGPYRAMLGVNLDDGAPEGGGVRIAGVSPGGPAEEAGVRPGDVIVAIQSKPVTTGREVVRAMESVKPGDKVALGVRRSGKPVDFEVEARPLDMMFFVGAPGARAIPALPALAATAPMAVFPFEGEAHWLLDDWGDAEFVTVTPGLGRYFGADKGVLVAHAPADAALGLKDGDVIVAIGGREPENGRHAMRILRSYQPGESVDLRILRDRKPQTLSAKIPERPAHHGLRRAPPAPPAPPVPPAAPGAATLD
jgi:S1-C subfamily serine protease